MRFATTVYLALFLTIFGMETNLLAQTGSSTITGRVMDASGALVPGVTIQIKNEGTDIAVSVSSDEGGLYLATLLPTGRYTVSATKAGFDTYSESNVYLAPGSTLNLAITLSIGNLATKVEVTTAPPVIQAESGELSSLQTSILFKDNPQPNYTLCAPMVQAMLTPGSSQRSYLSFYGNRFFETKVTANGLDIPSVGTPFADGSQDGMEAVKTYAILAPAEYAQSTTVDGILKSGTNDFHATGGVNMENLALDAIGPFDDTRPAGRPFTSIIANGGGPVYIPKIYNGRDKTFWYFSWDTRTRYGSLPVTQNVPTNPMRSGNFSQAGVTIKNPFTGQPFPNNQIPTSMINPTALNIQNAIYQPPDISTPNGVLDKTNGAFFDEQNRHQVQIQLDHQINSANHLAFDFLQGGQYRPRSPALCGPSLQLPGNLAGYVLDIDNEKAWAYQASWTSTISPRLLNELRFAFDRANNISATNLQGNSVVSQFGLQGLASFPGSTTIPQISILGFAQLTAQADSDNIPESYQIQDNFTWMKGQHELKFGTAIKLDDNYNVSYPSGTAGAFNFTGQFTGYAYADFLLGLPASVNAAFPRAQPSDVKSAEFGFYGQDSYRVTPSLTLNYGLRWETYTTGYDTSGLYYNFDQSTGSIVVPSTSAMQAISPIFPKSIPIVTAAQAGYPNHLINSSGRFLPRFSFAYRMGTSLVIRGGYGIYAVPPYAQETGDSRTQTGGPFQINQSYTNTITNGVPLIQFPQAVPAQLGELSSVDVTGVSKNFKLPYDQQWNLTIEKQVWNTSVRLSYIGQKDTQLAYTADINLPYPSTIPFSTDRLIYPNFRNVYMTENGGDQSYNALQINFTRPAAAGLTFQGGYTWAKALTDVATSDFSGYTASIEDPYARNLERGNSYIVPTHDVRFQVDYQVPVGRGRHWLAHPTNALQGFTDILVGGWTLNGIQGWNSGTWTTPMFSGNDPTGMGLFGGRPDIVAGCNPNSVPGGQTPNNFWNINCFQVPASDIGRDGNAGVGILEGPSHFYLDFGVFKQFELSNSWKSAYFDAHPVRLRFGATAANVLNHPIFDLPGANISSPATFGRITATTWGLMPYQFPSPRTLQFRMFLDF